MTENYDNTLFHTSKSLRHGGVVSKCEITSSKNPYSHYICFTISVRTNKLKFQINKEKFTKESEEIHTLIKSLHDSGLSYRQITKYLNDQGILTPKGKRWGVTGNSVYSILKRYKERQERLEFVDKKYEPVWGKMELKLLRGRNV
jgi:hypothetical protein